jgi:hypothetical protein
LWLELPADLLVRPLVCDAPLECELRLDLLLLDLLDADFLLELPLLELLLDLPEDFEEDPLFFFEPDPPFFPPPSCLLTVAHARRSASLSDTPRFSYPSSICSALRFCFAVYFDLSPCGISGLPSAELIHKVHQEANTTPYRR